LAPNIGETEFWMRSALLYKPLVAYFALSYVISWSILLLGAMLAPGSPLGILASTFGPLLAALALTLAEAGWGGVRALLGRATRWRVPVRWYALVLLGYGLVCLSAVGLTSLAGGFSPDLGKLQHLPDGAPLSLLPVMFLLILVVGGPLGEEFGWRGYALPRLQAGRGVLAASLVLGVLWAGWHVPLFWLPPSAQFGLVQGSGNYAFFIAQFFLRGVLLSVFFTWLYNSTKGNLLLPILLHASINTWDAWIDPFDRGALPMFFPFKDVVLVGVAVIVVRWTGARRLSGAPIVSPARS